MKKGSLRAAFTQHGTRWRIYLCLAGWACALNANAGINLYPFDDDTAYLAPAQAFKGWAAALQRHANQRDALLNCKAQKGCKGRLRSFERVLSSASQLSRIEQIELVHRYINRSKYVEDKARRELMEDGTRRFRRNHWATLYEFLRKSGDCEDYATAKYFMLRELGFEPDQLRIVVAFDRRAHGTHAVLAVQVADGKVWLLDSDNRIRRDNHRGFRYIYAMNEHSVWDHQT